MRYTLLEAVQLILSSLDGEEVNAYDDTAESLQVSHILRSIYYDIATDLDLPEHETMFELEASGSSSRPTLMTVPANVTKINWIKYNNKLTADTYSDYREVSFLPFDEFFTRQSSLSSQSSGVGEMTFTNNGESFEMMFSDDRMPQYYTSVDDYTLIFDSYDSDEDTTLQKSKTMCHGSVYPAFTLSDSFAPDLDPTQFSLWINAAKTRAFNELKQTINQESAAYARRQKIMSQRNRRRVPDEPAVFRVARFGRVGPFQPVSPMIAKNLRNGS